LEPQERDRKHLRGFIITSLEDFSNSFTKAAQLFRSHIEKGNHIRIITHNDADGIAAGGILSKVASRLGARFRTSSWKRVDDKYINDLAKEKLSIVVFSDLGGGYIDMLSEQLSNVDIIVLDHHLPINVEAPNIIHCNPLLHDIDGSRGISGAGVAYLFAKTVDSTNIDLSPLGITGALADQQDKGKRKTMLGLNKIIQADAENEGLLETNVDLIFYGYETRPIARACAYTTQPFIPGLSGREDRCLDLLKEAKIELKDGDRLRALRDLSEDEKRSLFSALTKHMIYEGCKPEMVHSLMGTIYTFKKEKPGTALRDAREFASMLNACARMGRPSLGLAICMGDRNEALREAEETLDDYRQKIGIYLDWVRKEDRVQEYDNIYVLKAGSEIDDTIIGVVASILLSTGILRNLKPFIATAHAEEGLLKVSARGTMAMKKSGLDLGVIMQKACEPFEGRGGGHDVAAGAFLPINDEDEFLRRVDVLVGEQING